MACLLLGGRGGHCGIAERGTGAETHLISAVKEARPQRCLKRERYAL